MLENVALRMPRSGVTLYNTIKKLAMIFAEEGWENSWLDDYDEVRMRSLETSKNTLCKDVASCCLLR